MGTVRGPAFEIENWPSDFHFITVDGTRLRYLDTGSGQPVVLLHGNGSMIEDFLSSGIIERAAAGRRFIAFDRPGFGYSDRPRDRSWGPFEQAALLLRALAQLNIERPTIVGHSWGTLVAIAMALTSPSDVAGLVLLSGYYYPGPRTKPMAFPTCFPFTDSVLRQTVVPFVRRLMAPDAIRRVFAPCPVPDRFRQAYSLALAMRTSQMQAVEEEAAMLPDFANMLCQLYRELNVPVRLFAGSHDRIVDTAMHSARLHQELATSTFHSVPECGHMVHHAAPDKVAAAIAAVSHVPSGEAGRRSATAKKNAFQRQWLHIGENLIAA